jgi:hypothetical protein
MKTQRIFAGVYGDGVDPEFPECIESFRPLQRMGTPDDVANVAEYLAGTWRLSPVGSIC